MGHRSRQFLNKVWRTITTVPLALGLIFASVLILNPANSQDAAAAGDCGGTPTYRTSYGVKLANPDYGPDYGYYATWIEWCVRGGNAHVHKVYHMTTRTKSRVYFPYSYKPTSNSYNGSKQLEFPEPGGRLNVRSQGNFVDSNGVSVWSPVVDIHLDPDGTVLGGVLGCWGNLCDNLGIAPKSWLAYKQESTAPTKTTDMQGRTLASLGDGGDMLDEPASHPTLVLQDQATRRIAFWTMAGLNVGKSGDVTSIPAPGWQVVGYDDYNKDGEPDIFLFNPDTGRIGIWVMNGLQVVQGLEVTNTLPAPWRVAGVGDYNGDGQIDFLIQNRDTSSVAIWLMSGLNVAGGDQIARSGADWKAVGMADFLNDGTPDIIFQNQVTGVLWRWTMNPASFQIVADGQVSPTPGVGWTVAAFTAYNSDGQLDILLQNQGAGRVAPWLMNGYTLAPNGGQVISNLVAPGWTVVAAR